MSVRMAISGFGDVGRKLERMFGKVKTGELMGKALKAGAEVFGEAIQGAMPRGKGTLKRSVKKGVRGRMTSKGPMWFSAIDRKVAPQGRFLYSGTKRQKARPEIFDSAIRGARTRARNTVQEKLLQIQWDL